MNKLVKNLLDEWVKEITGTGWGCKNWEEFTKYYTPNEVQRFVSLANFAVNFLREKERQ